MMDLTEKSYNRIFVVGELRGDLRRLMRFLYDQQFGYKDLLVSPGNLIDINNPRESISVLNFFKSNHNCYSVKGTEEVDYLRYINDENLKNKVNYTLLDEVEKEYKDYIENLPLIIKIPDYYYLVHAGVNPIKGITSTEVEPDLYYNIGKYDDNSRFYQFSNPEHKNWFEFKIFEGEKQVKIVYSAIDSGGIEVPAGYCLNRTNPDNQALKCMIITPESDPILLEIN